MLLRSLMFMMWRRDLGIPERPRDDDRREYDETDRVDPGIIRGLAVALRGNADIFSRVNTIGINRPVVRLRRITMERR